MRASTQEQKGSAGTNEVAANFEKIGWGPARNPDHDLGTDLYVACRDSRLIDLGMLIGVQVKAGPTRFKSTEISESGELVGWWYRESKRDHFDYWLNHHVPHLLVLHDLTTNTSHWVHVTEDSVTFLRTGAKILVPRAQTIDLTHADQLIAVASSQSRVHSWEGSAWTGGSSVSPTHAYRHALVVPRLIAPHPNLAINEFTAAQVTALVVLRRDSRRSNRTKGGIPNLDEVDHTWDWGWRFAAGVRSWVEGADIGGLRDALAAAREPAQEAAAAAALSAALFERDDPKAVTLLLGPLLEKDHLETVDHGWLRLQYARATYEAGQLEATRAVAAKVIGLSTHAPRDPTATAISGAAANLLFAAADWEGIDFGQTVAATDTAAMWWRQQIGGWGLKRHADDAFKRWAHNENRYSELGDAWENLRAASLMAGFLGDHSGWLSALERISQCTLASNEHRNDPPALENALRVLRTAGSHERLSAAARWLIDNGPAATVKRVADDCDPRRSTVTTLESDLALLAEAGDLLEPEHAASIMDWASATFDDPSHLRDSLHPKFDLQRALVEVLAGLVPALTADRQSWLLEWALDARSEHPGLTAGSMRKLITRIPNERWSERMAHRAANRAQDAKWPLRVALLRAAAPFDADVRAALAAEALEGDNDALWALGNVNQFEEDLVTGLINQSVHALADPSTKSRDSADAAAILVLLSLNRPDYACWEVLCDWIESVDETADLAAVLERLARGAGRLPAAVAERLTPVSRRLAERITEEHRMWSEYQGEARFLTAALHNRLQGQLPATTLALLLTGARHERQFAALLCGSSDSIGDGVLTALSVDADCHVRATAASVAAHRAREADRVGVELVGLLLKDDGVAVPRVLAEEAASHPSRAVADVLASLAAHPSGRVRTNIARVCELIEDLSTSSSKPTGDR